MAIDFTLSPEQKEIQAQARDFAQKVLAPLAPKIDEEPDPLRRLADGQAGLRGGLPKRASRSRCCRRRYGGGGLSNVDFVIAAEEIQAVDPGLRDDRARERPRPDAGLVLRDRGAEAALHRRRRRRHEQRVHRRLRRERAAGLPGRDGELRRARHRRRRHGRDRHARRRQLRPQRAQVLAVQRRRLGQPGREPEPRRRAAPTRPQRRDRGTVGDHRRARHPGRHVRHHQHPRPAHARRTSRSRSTTRASRPATCSRARRATATC